MKNHILLFIALFICSNNLFSQENRSDRGWNDTKQTTYYMGEKSNSINEFRSTPYPKSEANHPDNNNDNGEYPIIHTVVSE